MNDGSMKKPRGPSAASLEEMPEINERRFRRRPGRGHYASRSVGEIVTATLLVTHQASRRFLVVKHRGVIPLMHPGCRRG
jgi:hypothetical protein